MSVTRRGLVTLAAGTLAAPALAAGVRRWRMVTAWPRDLPGPGVSARRLCDRIAALTGGALEVDIFAAGELAPGGGVLSAVGSGAAEMGHSASVFDTGWAPAAALFTSAPFGLAPTEHLGWLAGDGDGLWEDLYRPLGAMPMAAGNTGPSMGGWFREPVARLDDLAGRRMRIAGLGADVMAQLGVVPVQIAVPEIFGALASGVVDATEFAAPFTDIPLGFHQVAPHYIGPGFHEPNGVGMALVNAAEWDGLDDTLREALRHAAAAEHATSLGETVAANAAALNWLAERGIRPALWPADVMAAARPAARETMARLAASGTDAARIVESYDAALEQARIWSRAGVQPFLAARDI